MKTHLSKRIVAFLLTMIMVLSLMPMVFAEETAKEDLTGKTVILHTNDTHGALMGFAQVAKVKADYEAKGAKVILVDAGDFSQGTTYVSTNKGEAAVTVMNAAGYDYVTLGNHEFDFGYAQLKANLEKATFLPICADVLLKENGNPAFAPYAVKEVNGMKIGFFGMETPETFTKVNPGLIQEITFPQGEELYACAQAQVDALKNTEHADIIIGLVHLGVDAESAPNRSVDLYKNVTGIDFLIDGHSHTVMTEGPNGEPIQSTGTKADKTALMNVGLIVIDNATKKIEKNELIPLGENAPVDETVAAKAQEIMTAVDAEYGTKFATSEVDLNGDKAPGNRTMETNLGDLITDSMRWGVLKDMNAETLGVPEENVVAITNGGGIRAWIKKGDVTKNDVNTVLPFGNTVAVVYVKGSELLEALEASTYCTPTAVGGFPQVSGMKISINTNKEFDQGEQYPESTYYKPASIQRISIEEVNGKAFDPAATYAVVTNNFCAAGGDTYYAFKAASSQFDTGLPLDEVLMDFITTELNGTIGEAYAEPQGRLAQAFQFVDVTDPTQFFYDYVYWAYNHDPQITAGTGDGTTFSPYAPCTREQVVTFLWAAAGKPNPGADAAHPFSDVGDAYYTDPVRWAYNYEPQITAGIGGGLFGTGLTCTRAEIVTFLWAAAGKPDPKTAENIFTDVHEGEYWYDAVRWAYANEITAGVGDNLFGTYSPCTRGQIVTFLYKAVKWAEQADPEDPKPEDPKPEDPKPEDPKPEDPKPEEPIGKALGNYPTADACIKPNAFVDLIHTVQIWGAYDRTGSTDSTHDNTPAMLSIVAPLKFNGDNYLSEGDIFMEHINALYPEDENRCVYQVEMTGDELYYWLEFAATKLKKDSSGNVYVPTTEIKNYNVIMGEGFHYEIDMAKPKGQRIVNLTYLGEAILEDQKFTVAMDSFSFNNTNPYVVYVNDEGFCELDLEARLIYSTEGQSDGTIYALLVSYIKEQTAQNGGISPAILSDWLIR